MIRHRKTHPSRRLLACVSTILLGFLAAAPAVSASTGAVDQYTEQPPTNPAGDGHDLSTGTAGSGGGSPTAGAPGVVPYTPQPAGAANDLSSGASGPSGAGQGQLGVSDWPWREIAIGAVAALTGPEDLGTARGPASYGADDPTLPLLGYPVTPLILALMTASLAGLALAGGLGAYRRLRPADSGAA